MAGASRQFNLSVVLSAVDRISKPMRAMGQNMRKMGRPIERMRQRLERLSTTALKVGSTMTKVGKSLFLKLTLPIAFFGARVIKTATDFQSAMNFVGAVTRATGEDFKILEKTALRLGRTTQFSAIESAQGMKLLGLAGLKTKQIIGALPNVLELAASAQLDLGSASQIVTDIMFGLSMKTKNLAMVNDVLVNAFTKAKVDLLSLGQAFKKAGTGLKVAGVDFKTTTALLMQLGQAGQVGGIAGRGLRRMVTELGKLRDATKKEMKVMRAIGLDPRDLFDSTGKLKDMVEVLKVFEKTNLDLTFAVELLGQLGGSTMLSLLEGGSNAVAGYRDKLAETGIASRVAQSQMKGLPGVMKRLVSVWESFKLAIVKAGLGEVVERWTTRLNDLIESLSEANPELLLWGTIIAGLAALLAPVIFSIGLLVKGIGMIAAGIAALAKLKVVFTFLLGFFAALKVVVLGHPVIALVTALAIAGLWIFRRWQPVQKLFQKIGELWDWWAKKAASFAGVLKDLVPDWIKDMFSGKDKNVSVQMDRSPGANVANNVRRLAGAGPRGLDPTKSDINIKVTADKGTVATVEGVRTRGNAANVNVASVGFVGAVP